MAVDETESAEPKAEGPARASRLRSTASAWSERLSLLAHPGTLREARDEVRGHAVASDHGPHLEEALAWLTRAQDVTGTGGFARGYSLTNNKYFGGHGWQAAYPETTGYIIPTFYLAAKLLKRPDLARRATAAASWEADIQLADGGIQGGTIAQPAASAVFNTGMVLFGWLAALEETGDHRFADASRRAGAWLVAAQEPDGDWSSKGHSRYARPGVTRYNARVAWALAEAGARLHEPAFLEGAARNLRLYAAQVRPNGWLADCCLTDSVRPLTHTLAYASRGFIEGGRVIADESVMAAGARMAEGAARAMRPDGAIPGRLGADMQAAAPWVCLTGCAQFSNNLMRLSAITSEARYREPVSRLLAFVKRTQNRSSDNPGLRGGIKGSFPVSGDYGRYQLLNWATKFFADALMRDDLMRAGRGADDQPLA